MPAWPARVDSLLWLRAAIVSALTFQIGAVGHTTSGGLLPSVSTLVAMFAVGTVICAVFLTRPASTGRLVALVAVGQVATHGLFSLTAGHVGDTGPATGALHPSAMPVAEGQRVGSLQDYYEASISAAPTSSALSIPDPAVLLDHAPMFVAHLVVAVLIGLWLAAGERLLFGLLALVFTAVFTAVVALFATLAPVVLPARGRAPLRRRPATLPSLARVSRIVVRRGPPALLPVHRAA